MIVRKTVPEIGFFSLLFAQESGRETSYVIFVKKKTKREKKEKGGRREEGREREYKGLKRMTPKAALDPTTDRKGNKGTTNQKGELGPGDTDTDTVGKIQCEIRDGEDGRKGLHT